MYFVKMREQRVGKMHNKKEHFAAVQFFPYNSS